MHISVVGVVIIKMKIFLNVTLNVWHVLYKIHYLKDIERCTSFTEHGEVTYLLCMILSLAEKRYLAEQLKKLDKEIAMRLTIAEEESALYLQTWWRSVLGYRDGQARLIAHRNQIKRQKSAISIQNCWRCYLAKQKVEHKRLVQACLRVQNAWRCKQGRQSAHLLRAARNQIAREEKEAQELADKLAKEMNAKRLMKEQEEQAKAATAIQGRFRYVQKI